MKKRKKALGNMEKLMVEGENMKLVSCFRGVICFKGDFFADFAEHLLCDPEERS